MLTPDATKGSNGSLPSTHPLAVVSFQWIALEPDPALLSALCHSVSTDLRILASKRDTTLGVKTCHRDRSESNQLIGMDLTALLLSSVFLGVGFIIAKYFPEASLLAGVFLVGLAILNIALFFAT